MGMDAARLGQNMFDAVHSLAAGDLANDAQARWEAIAEQIINEITTYAEIKPLDVTAGVPGGSPVHTHTPQATETVTGKIS